MKYKVINDQLIIEIDKTTQGQTILEYFHSMHLSKKTNHLLRQNKEYLYNHQFVDYNQVLKKGDQVLSVTSEFIAVQRKNGEVEVLPMVKDKMGRRVDIEHIITIGYGNNTVKAATDEIVVTTF